MTIEWVVLISLTSLLVGGALGYLLRGRDKVAQTRVAELEVALEAKQAELGEYREQVYGQFATTAERFKALDQSYHALHRQLAESAVALCGDEATPLLTQANGEAPAAPEASPLDPVDGEIVVSEQADVDIPVITERAEPTELEAEAQSASPSADEVDPTDDKAATSVHGPRQG